MTRNPMSLTAVLFLSMGLPVLAQIDLSGSWQSKNHEDALERGAGPNPGDVREETGRLGQSLSNVTSFGEGLGGDLYVIAGGTLYRFSG